MSAQASPLNATRPANAAGTWRRREESKTTAFSPYRQKLQSPLLPDMRELTAKTLNGACMQAGSVAEFQPGLQKGATPGDTAGWAESAGLVSRRRFWRDCKWVQFLPPSREGFAAARQHPACTAGMPCSPSLAKCTFCSCEPAVLVVIPQRAAELGSVWDCHAVKFVHILFMRLRALYRLMGKATTGSVVLGRTHRHHAAASDPRLLRVCTHPWCLVQEVRCPWGVLSAHIGGA